MTIYNPMRELPARAGYGKGDFLVLCGELFGRGYANGIVEEAKSRGMTVIGTTVGRRDADGTLHTYEKVGYSRVSPPGAHRRRDHSRRGNPWRHDHQYSS